MGAGDFGDFIKQVPLSILLAPICFGVIYIGLMVFIFRRAADRRRKKREAALAYAGVVPEPQPAAPTNNPILGFLRGQIPDNPVKPAAWTVPAALRTVPEPDLDLLANPSSLNEPIMAMSTPIDASFVTPIAAPRREEVLPISQPEKPPVVPASVPTSAPMPVSAGAAPSDAVEVMRVWRDLSDGSLIIQMGEQRYRTLAEIQNADLTRRFSALVRELNVIVSGTPGRATGVMPVVPDAPVVPLPDTSAGSLKARIGVMQVEEPMPKPSVVKQMTRRLGKEDPKAQPTTPPGIADAVESFLQFKLTNTPEMSTRSIHIRPAHDHGVRIEVDGHYYDSIPEVVDPDVRDFLLNMMKEWEARQ